MSNTPSSHGLYITQTHIYIYIYYDEAIDQRNSKAYIYAYSYTCMRVGMFHIQLIRMYYAHLWNILFHLTMSLLVAIVIDEQSFQLR